ncbi:MAG: transketolase [Verrucomicrobia bacterium]|jgi:transketolase|nr:transketolase [Verrucomicrobiota bacterium]
MAIKATLEELQLIGNTIRGLSMDGVQAANSGHPGMPMGMADVAAVLWLNYLNHCPAKTDWADRDRFVLSGGHGSMLLYSMLHLSGYDLPISELEQFRQWDSKTPGHPEVGHTVGVETTTGPLGQGCGNGVGMALAERMLSERYNTDEVSLVDHYTYVFCGDGDLMEGISHEAFSLAGHLGLNKLIVFFDDNEITIEGRTNLATSDSTKLRFKGYNWNIIEIDAHDFVQIEKAIRKARRSKDKPTLVVCKTTIGKGSPNKADTSSVHGEPLGADEVVLTKQNLGLPEDQKFYVPETVRAMFDKRLGQLKRSANKWGRTFKAYAAANPELAASWTAGQDGIVPEDLEAYLPEFEVGTSMATRAASGKVIQSMAKAIPHLVGGSADLAPSNKSRIDDSDSILPGEFEGRNFHFGVREHAMGSLLNGLALHGGFRVFGATFFVFVDYMRPTVRLAALMNLPIIYVFTHDSFYVGEDGPTHEPIEQLASLRCIPGMTTIRPADPTETGAAWVAAMKNTDGPTALLLTRQNLDVIDRSVYPAAANLEKGAYTLWQSGEGSPDVLLIGSGSELELVFKAAKELAAECNVRVVSMPCWELFDAQPEAYRAETIPVDCATILAVEAACSMGWERYIGTNGRMIAMDHFGASAPAGVLAEKFGYTVENVVATVREMRG